MIDSLPTNNKLNEAIIKLFEIKDSIDFSQAEAITELSQRTGDLCQSYGDRLNSFQYAFLVEKRTNMVAKALLKNDNGWHDHI